LSERDAVVDGQGGLAGETQDTLSMLGAEVRPPASESEAATDAADIYVFDASGFAVPSDLRALYDFFHDRVRALRSGGRVVVLSRPTSDVCGAARAAAREALDGFVRSVAKEIGRKGSTANLVEVAEGAEDRLAGPLAYICSDRAAFLTGQRWVITSEAATAPKANLHRQSASLEGMTALVTGAARGIGAATARRLAEEGAGVLCLDLPADAEALEALAGAIGGVPVLADLTDDTAPQRVAEAANEEADGVDIVIHNAGIIRDKTLGRMSEAAWDLTLAVNLEAPIRVTQALLQAGALRDGGRIIHLSSVAGIAGNAGQTNYASAKAGLRGWTRALSAELAPRGITVNAVAPGFIETRMTATIPFAIREGGRRLSALGQGGLPIDVAELITFLSTPAAAGLTGRTLRICGGALIGA
jgi:3-oxoacyl-[acyl-carrier protein] reductase